MKVLIAEDSCGTRRLLQATLRNWGYVVISTSDGEQAWNAIRTDESIQLAVLDWVMPGRDGLDVCSMVRGPELERYVYVLLLTGKNEQQSIIQGLQAGADDFLTKPFDLAELEQRLRAGRRIVELHEQLLLTQLRLQQQARHDALTGALNRSAILDFLKRELESCAQDNSQVGVVMIDLDHFKRINDTWGHRAGDRVLQHITRLLRASVRGQDALGRLGGEEFLIVLRGASVQQSAEVAERIRQRLADNPVRIEGRQFFVSASFGVASSSVMQVPAVDDLVHTADIALYVAKRDGRNCVRQPADRRAQSGDI